MPEVKPYCEDLNVYHRLKTREVMIGDIALGADNPIRIQSMTTTNTMDTAATVEQSIRMIDAGCEFVRITAPSKNEAHNLENIKSELLTRGYKTPLIADIHFTPNAAEIAAGIVEKVRVNPGNYADKKKFDHHEYNDETYNAELERIRERFTPLVRICKREGTAMRIGTNHGSLSDRIMSRYGDTPEGMVESALEFLRICRDEDYHDIVLSMKASNPQVMVHAYRLLVARMLDEGMNYPLHLGVTEAGEGEDGRIKSAMGIGTLLEDGIGDTIRVSLTEEPEFEVPVAIALADRYKERQLAVGSKAGWDLPYDPYSYKKRDTKKVLNIGGKNVPRVIIDLSDQEIISAASLEDLGYSYSEALDKWNLGDQACDFVYTGNKVLDFEIPGTLGVLLDYRTWESAERKDTYFPLINAAELSANADLHPSCNFICGTADEIIALPKQILEQDNIVIILDEEEDGILRQRSAFIHLMNEGLNVPVIISRKYNVDEEKFQLFSATDAGALLLDGMGDGVWFVSTTGIKPSVINSTSFGILQASRTRISKTEYISCPSCGRTLFDLQETTAKIRARTDHLKGVKIGIMGCIVNGPGEMADADYGYVGTGVGKITLYKGQEVVKRSIDSELAVDALIDLIKEHGDWVEKAQVLTAKTPS